MYRKNSLKDPKYQCFRPSPKVFHACALAALNLSDTNRTCWCPKPAISRALIVLNCCNSKEFQVFWNHITLTSNKVIWYNTGMIFCISVNNF